MGFINDVYEADPVQSESLQKFAEKVEGLSGHRDKAEGVMIDARAARQVVNAWIATDREAIKRDPAAAAAAFDRLCSGAGLIMRHVPFPISAVGAFLEMFDGFVANTRANIVSGPRTPRDEKLQAIADQAGSTY